MFSDAGASLYPTSLTPSLTMTTHYYLSDVKAAAWLCITMSAGVVVFFLQFQKTWRFGSIDDKAGEKTFVKLSWIILIID